MKTISIGFILLLLPIFLLGAIHGNLHKSESASADTITVTSPNDGESLKIAQTHNISRTNTGATVTLEIKSAPDTGVPVTVSPDDKNGQGSGTTDFYRTYNPGVEVTLTAPASYNGREFIKWKVDNADQSGRTIKITMSSDHTAQAIYRSSTCTLTVQSSPDSGIPITVSPMDKNNNGNGNTAFIRTYDFETIVTLTAPATYNGKNFSRWLIDGTGNSNPTIEVTMDTNHTVHAVYQSDTYTLAVQSSPYTGIGIAVSPADKNGYGNGNTTFIRTYEPGKVVTLLAPSEVSGSNFIKWSVDGKEYTDLTIQVTLDGNHTAVVYYETANPPEISVNRSRLNLGYIIGSNNLPKETFTVYNSGGGTLNWTVSTEIEGVGLNPTSGTDCGVVEVIVNPVGLLPATFKGVIYVTDPLVSNSPVAVEINLWVKQDGTPPFGDFSTPLDGTTVYSSIPVTGWALGDTGIEGVKIYREEGTNLAYIGDALLVEGARPDIETAYPDYPMNYKAGWGYMMLTNFLPNGNGVFNIHAIATDKEGRTADLGTKTITVDNASAIKPFGAIDIPAPGGTATGTNHRNHGWVLTPPPNRVPENGSTINVYVDGVYLGHPVYNIYRPDIAALFPGYINSNGAGAYFDFDTTAYENGIHSIFWTAADNAGNTDGIGSRFFMIQNGGCMSGGYSNLISPLEKFFIGTPRRGDREGGVCNKGGSSNDGVRFPVLDQIDISSILSKDAEPITLFIGFTETPEPQVIYPGAHGIIEIEIHELERVEIHWPGNREPDGYTEQNAMSGLPRWLGYQVIGDRLRPLPVGSSLDCRRGIFYWLPGPGFYGDYDLAFIKLNNPDRKVSRIRIRILPKSTAEE